MPLVTSTEGMPEKKGILSPTAADSGGDDIADVGRSDSCSTSGTLQSHYNTCMQISAAGMVSTWLHIRLIPGLSKRRASTRKKMFLCSGFPRQMSRSRMRSDTNYHHGNTSLNTRASWAHAH